MKAWGHFSNRGRQSSLKPIKVIVPTLPGIRAITLWPFVLIEKAWANDECIWAHELYHWHQALRMGVLPFYLLYVFWAIFNIGKPASSHHLEQQAYAMQRHCEEEKQL